MAQVASIGIVEGVGEFAVVLRGGTGDLSVRKDEEIWSPLEYGCHLRDVLLVQRERVLAARRTVRPFCEPMGRDERAEHDGYSEQSIDDVAQELTDAARLFANVLVRLELEDWERTVIYGYPSRTDRSLRWVAVHTLHEVRHHLLDVRRQVNGHEA